MRVEVVDVKKISVLGATGSVGRQTLDVIQAFPERFEVIAMTASENVEQMADIVRRHRPAMVAMASKQAAEKLEQLISREMDVQVLSGPEGVEELASLPEVDIVVAAIVGRAGLAPVYRAIQAKKVIALANKESLVMAGELVVERAKTLGASIIPVDSEHAAAHQLIEAIGKDRVEKIILTASGGPFFGRSYEELCCVSSEDALDHPNWSMGAKISIDSATMMNKGFEIVEARWLFGLSSERIDVVVHPESLIHAIVETVDGSLLAQMSNPDMKGPIAYALGYPELLDLPGALPAYKKLDLAGAQKMTFYKPDLKNFPAMNLCRQAMERGGGVPAALTVADEVVVNAFLKNKIQFVDIAEILSKVIERYSGGTISTFEDVLAAGEQGERLAVELIKD
jgi:1-deoxy-D-xylulose-5-phosphate reductoisomerase